MKKTVLLSDIDGTLVDSNALHAEAWRRAFEHFGIEVSMDELWRQIGKGGDHLIPVFLPKDRAAIGEDLKQFRKDLFHRDYMPRVVPFPKSRELLVKVKQTGGRVLLATSSDKADLAVYKKIVGMEELIEDEATSSDVERSKPEPDIFSAALQKAGVAAEDAVALGDTPYDAQASCALGIRVIGVTCGGWRRSDLVDAGCVAVYKDPADLLAHFDSSLLVTKPH